MSNFLFCLLCVLTVLLLLDGLRRKEGLLQFQVLFVAAFGFSIIPQMVNFVYSPERLPLKVHEHHGVEWGLVICISCLMAGVIGFRWPHPGKLEAPTWMPVLNFEKMFRVGLFLYAIGMVGAWKLAGLSGGFTAQFTGGGHYALEWSGLPVVYIYIAKLLYPALILCLMSSLANGTLVRWSIVAVMFIYPLCFVLFLGRRFVTFHLATIVLCAIWFRKGWLLPRIGMVLGFVVGGAIIILAPAYRTSVSQSGDILEAAANVEAEQRVDMYLSGERGEGMENLIIGVPARYDAKTFALGAGIWNTFVDDFIPGQLLGRSLKKALMIGQGVTDDDSDLFWRFCGESIKPGSFWSGPYSVYREFFVFGCVIYFAMGRFSKWLWNLANLKRNVAAQILYSSLVIQIPRSVVNSVHGTFSDSLLFILIFLTLTPFMKESSTRARRKAKATIPARKKMGPVIPGNSAPPCRLSNYPMQTPEPQ